LAVKIRLTRMGRKKRPFYRIVVTDSRSPRDGRFIERIGTYDPLLQSSQVEVDAQRVNYWLDQGAIPSDTVRSLLRHEGILYQRILTKKGLDEAQIQEEMKKWEVLQIERKRRAEAKDEAKSKKKAKAEETEIPPDEVKTEETETPSEETRAEETETPPEEAKAEVQVNEEEPKPEEKSKSISDQDQPKAEEQEKEMTEQEPEADKPPDLKQEEPSAAEEANEAETPDKADEK